MVMQKEKTAIKGGVLLALTIISLTTFAAPARAVVKDSSVVHKLTIERNSLLNKEEQLQEDYADIERQLRELQRQDDKRAVDQLCKDMDVKYADLQGVRHSIKNLDLRLL